jgi:hypothetical protein
VSASIPPESLGWEEATMGSFFTPVPLGQKRKIEIYGETSFQITCYHVFSYFFSCYALKGQHNES